MGLTKTGWWLVVLSMMLGLGLMTFAYRTHIGVPSQRLQAAGWNTYLKIRSQPSSMAFTVRCIRNAVCRKAYNQITPPFSPLLLCLYLSPIVLGTVGFVMRQPIQPMREDPMKKFTQPEIAKGYLYRSLPKPRIPSKNPQIEEGPNKDGGKAV